MPVPLEEDIPDMSMQSTASSATNSSAEEGKGVGVSNVVSSEEINGSGDDVSHLGHSQHDDHHDLQATQFLK